MAENFDELLPQSIASACGGEKRVNDNHYKALCPAHADATPSLDINRKDGKILVVCRAGCSQGTVFDAVIDRCKSAGLLSSGLASRKKRRSLDDRIAELNKRYAVVDYEGRILVVALQHDPDNFRLKPVFYEPAQFMRKHANDRVQSGKKDDTVSIAQVWFNHPNRRTYDSVIFSPTSDVIVAPRSGIELPPGRSFNLFMGYMARPQFAHLTEPRSVVSGESEDACARLLEHAREVICGGSAELFDYWMAWHARLFQVPGECGRTALVMQSPEGAGKDTVTAQALGPSLGGHYFAAARPLDLLGRFNDHLGTCVLAVFNEAAATSDKAMVGALKQLITDPQLPVEQKFLPRVMRRNCVHLVIQSNEAWAVPVSISDRRFVFFKVSSARIGDREYFRQLYDEIQNGGREALLGVLLAHNIADKDVSDLPSGQSDARYEQQLFSGDTVERFVLEWLGSGDPVLSSYGLAGTSAVTPVTNDDCGPLPDWDSQCVMFTKEDLHRGYLMFCQAHRFPKPHTLDLFCRQLRGRFPGLVQESRPTVRGERKRVVVFPPLDDARRVAQATVRGRIPWIESGS